MGGVSCVLQGDTGILMSSGHGIAVDLRAE